MTSRTSSGLVLFGMPTAMMIVSAEDSSSACLRSEDMRASPLNTVVHSSVSGEGRLDGVRAKAWMDGRVVGLRAAALRISWRPRRPVAPIIRMEGGIVRRIVDVDVGWEDCGCRGDGRV